MNKLPRIPSKIYTPTLLILFILNLALLFVIGWPYWQRGELPKSALFNDGHSPTPHTPEPATATLPIIKNAETPVSTIMPVYVGNGNISESGLIILGLSDGPYTHLFAYHPQTFPLTRLTNGNWDDADPSVSPDGTRIAFRSHRNGYWDIYILDLTTNSITRVTDTPAYDGSPTWSPDGQWMAYESYVDDSLEIFIRSTLDLTQPPIQLTKDAGTNYSPAWSPMGREIAFVSSRSGEDEIWTAQLDQTDQRFKNVSNNGDSRDTHPAWSPDGKYLAWSSEKDGTSEIYTLDINHPDGPARQIGLGHQPVWSPDDGTILSYLGDPNLTGMQAYTLADRTLVFSVAHMPGSLHGMDWKTGKLPDLITKLPLPEDSRSLAVPLWNSALTLAPLPPNGRFGIVPINDVSAPYAYLNDAVDDSFTQLRKYVAQQTGWDFLATLENAYFPLTEPLSPKSEENWLMTGRAFATNPMPLYAGWMAIVQENYNGQTYWRMYIKPRYQDGSQGVPLKESPWDINARYSGKTKAYEEGGAPAAIPPGYWVDFTEIARRFGWERLPSLNDWRTYYPAIRFNQYVITDGLDWRSAMAEVYPPEALVTVTYQPTYTPTITLTPEHFELFTITPSTTPTLTPTLNPTWTPQGQ